MISWLNLFNLSLTMNLGKFERQKMSKKIFKLNPKFTDADRVYSSLLKYQRPSTLYK